MTKDWNQAYEAGETPWDKGYASPPLCEFLKTHSVKGRVLVPGCGTGHDVRALAAQGASVVGLDVARSAVRMAEAFPAAGEERYALGDFLNPDPCHAAAYDWLVEHTCLCALDPELRTAYARSVRQVLKPGGYFLAIFFREVPDYTGDGPPHPISRESIDALFGDDFSVIERRTPTKSYPSRPAGAEEVVWMRFSPNLRADVLEERAAQAEVELRKKL